MKTPVLALAIVLGMLASSSGDTPRVRIEVHISKESENESGARRPLLKRKENPKAKPGADFALVATSGKPFKAADFSEFIAPTSFDPPEYVDQAEAINRKDGSILLVNSEKSEKSIEIDGRTQKLASFPVTPVNPTAFEMFNIGWEIEGTPRLSDEGLVVLEAEVRHHDARPATAHFGEGSGPIVAKGKTAFGREVEIVLTENKAMMASTSVTRTPLLLRARPGVTYPIEVMLGDKAVAATILCTLVSDGE